MQKEDIVVGLFTDNTQNSDVEGLRKGFEKIGLKVMSVDECIEKDIAPNLTIGFNNAGLNHWQKFLSKGISNLMISTDSAFVDNYEIIKQFASFKNFIFLHTTTADNQLIGKFLPSLLHGYLPMAIDTEFWNETDKPKDIDITIDGQIIDADTEIERLRSTMPDLVFKLMMEIIDIALLNPTNSLQDICVAVQKQMDFEFNDEQIVLFMTELPKIITTRLYEKILEKVQNISGLNIVLLGDNNWQKYKKDSIQILTPADDNERRNILQRSKIVLSITPHSTMGGIHKTILQAISCGAMIMTPINAILKGEFSETLGYFNPAKSEEIEAQIKMYLENENERATIAKSAKHFVTERNDWKNRAQAIYDIIDVN